MSALHWCRLHGPRSTCGCLARVIAPHVYAHRPRTSERRLAVACGLGLAALAGIAALIQAVTS